MITAKPNKNLSSLRVDMAHLLDLMVSFCKGRLIDTKSVDPQRLRWVFGLRDLKKFEKIVPNLQTLSIY
jgi:hypothetical protein